MGLTDYVFARCSAHEFVSRALRSLTGSFFPDTWHLVFRDDRETRLVDCATTDSGLAVVFDRERSSRRMGPAPTLLSVFERGSWTPMDRRSGGFSELFFFGCPSAPTLEPSVTDHGTHVTHT